MVGEGRSGDVEGGGNFAGRDFVSRADEMEKGAEPGEVGERAQGRDVSLGRR